MKITKAKLRAIIAEEVSLREQEKKNNAFAICTDSVGREDKKKYESCVKSVKKDQGIAEVLNEISSISEEDAYDSLQKEKAAFKSILSSTVGSKLLASFDNVMMDRVLTSMVFAYQYGRKREREEPAEEGMPDVGERQ